MLTKFETIAMSQKLVNDAVSRKGIKPTLRNYIVAINEIRRLNKINPTESYSKIEDLAKFFTPWYR